jgi:hypothetical protein
MRRLAAFVLASTCTAFATQAQEARLFQNSWFWGVHAGATSLGTSAGAHGHAGTLGADWFITRTVGGLYVSYDQANFTRTGQVADASGTAGVRDVRLNDLRTFSIAGVAYPKSFGKFRPYAGLGLALELIGTATPLADPITEAGQTSPTISNTVAQKIDDARSQTSVLLMGGVQWQVNHTALYGQLNVIPSANDFLLNNTVTNISLGVRYNFGSSIDK